MYTRTTTPDSVHKKHNARQYEHRTSGVPTKWAQGIYYNEGIFREALVYHDDEALYFELRGKDSGIVRFSFEMLETLGRVIEEEQEDHGPPPPSS